MANGTFYADALNGSDANDGLTEVTAKQTLSALFGLGTGGGNTYYIQAGTPYVLTAAASVPLSGDATDGPNVIRGYTTTPGADDGRPIITSSTNSVGLINLNASHVTFRHLKFTHTAATRGRGIYPTAADRNLIHVYDCVFDGTSIAIDGEWVSFYGFNNMIIEKSIIENCTGTFAISTGNGLMRDCIVRNNTGYGWLRGAYADNTTMSFQRCMFSGNSVNVYWNTNKTGCVDFSGCVIRGASSHGIQFAHTTATVRFSALANIILSNGGYGITSGIKLPGIQSYNAFMSNTSGNRGVNVAAGSNDITLTADPFVDAANGDFNINSATGGGSLLRATNFTI